MKPRLYRYVGPAEIRMRARQQRERSAERLAITSPEDFQHWLTTTDQQPNRDGSITVTFVIDSQGRLRIADRHSEHVACANGEPVRSAGEMTWSRTDDQSTDDRWDITWVTNQSTGYCPEPESWEAVRIALDTLGFSAGSGFDQAFHFRRCPKCGTTNLFEDFVFVCEVCGSNLPKAWNFEV